MVAVLSLTFDSLVVGVGLKVVVLRACRRQTGLAAALDGGRVDMPNALVFELGLRRRRRIVRALASQQG